MKAGSGATLDLEIPSDNQTHKGCEEIKFPSRLFGFAF
jgi:hypothetical protein